MFVEVVLNIYKESRKPALSDNVPTAFEAILTSDWLGAISVPPPLLIFSESLEVTSESSFNFQYSLDHQYDASWSKKNYLADRFTVNEVRLMQRFPGLGQK